MSSMLKYTVIFRTSINRDLIVWKIRFKMTDSNGSVSKQRTSLDMVCAKLDWQIDGFDKLMRLSRLGQDLISDKFSVPQAKDIVWELHIYPKGKRDEDINNVSLFLRQVGMNQNQDPIMTEFRVYCICPLPMGPYNICRDNKEFVHGQGRGKFRIGYDRIQQAIHEDGHLRVVCEVEFVPPTADWKAASEENVGKESAKSSGVESKPNVDIRPLLDSEMLIDCVLQVGNEQLKCHRCILALHSDVFRQMFDHSDTKEAQHGTVAIPDTTVDAAKAMLEFMYTGTATLSGHHGSDILALAEKYGVFKLKDICEMALSTSVDSTNACKLLIFADTYRASRLRDAAIKYIQTNHAQILDSDEWKSMKESNPVLASDILEVVLGGCGTSRSLSVSYTTSPAFSSSPGSSADTGTDVAPAETSTTKSPPKKRARRGR